MYGKFISVEDRGDSFNTNVVIETEPDKDLLDLTINKSILEFVIGENINSVLDDQDTVYQMDVQNSTIMTLKVVPPKGEEEELKSEEPDEPKE